jgi:cytochrome c oxidase cbb3-type subunit 4
MDIDLNTLRSLVTLLSFFVFGGIVYWACSSENKARFDEAANIPFTDEGEEYPQAVRAEGRATLNLQKVQK